MDGDADTAMHRDRWRLVLAAADHALELPPDAREAFVTRWCGDDPTLGAELRALLAGAAASSPLDGSAAALAGPFLSERSREPETVPVSPIGPYRVVREIGRGGMGTVYLAERADDQYRKRVALKLLPSWSAADEHHVRRFIEERQILAALEHPDIARLLDGGVTSAGLPWFAMEYVEGAPMDQYCDTRRLSIERRLELFRRVCAAVAYAHRNLVVHRDLKPGNILVTPDGGVKLLDFGIAKLLGDDAGAALTQPGERLMTPLYASPEQVRGGPVSTASDVYALGVLLYELLCGRHPYRLTSTKPYEIARAILEQDPEPPSALLARPKDIEQASRAADARGLSRARLVRRLKGDLDTIVLTAMQKDPARRYGTVEQLADDVARHLAGVPLAARPEGRIGRARKFVRRHPVAVPVGAGVALVIVGFGVVTAVQAIRLRAEVERVAAESARSEQVITYLRNLFRTDGNPRMNRGVSAREMLDTAAGRLDRELVRQPAARAQLMFEVGRAYHELNVPDRARRLLDSSVALHRTVAPGGSRELARTLDLLGTVLLEQGDLAGAERADVEALRMRRQLLGARSGDVARTLDGLAAVRRAEGHLEDAKSLALEALAIDEARSGDTRADVAQSLRTVGDVLFASGDYAGAARRYDRALALQRAVLPDEHPAVAAAVLDLATALRGAGQRATADSLFRYGLALYRRVAPNAVASPLPALPSSRTPVTAPTPGTIVFVSDRDGPDPVGDLGNQEIYVMNADGTGQRRLTFDGGVDAAPAWSPDGKRIAFHSNRIGTVDIFTMNADGTDQRRLTHMDELKMGAVRPRWSPDGARLVFQTFFRPEVYVIDTNGGNLTNLTNHPARDQWPDWSPDGRRIAFTSDRDGNDEIYVMNADGTHLVRLTSNPAPDQVPAWSPDGARIAFVSARDHDREIYVMNADGTHPTRLTVHPGQDGAPAWSRDGTRIAFNRQVLGHVQVYVMNPDGSAQTRLTELSTVAFNGWANWGPVLPAREQPH
jgi:serine/threonine-protein kinase